MTGVAPFGFDGVGPGDEACLVFAGGVGVFGFLLHVVVAELNDEDVARLDEREDLFETAAGVAGGDGLAGLGVVGDGDGGFEEARQHLAPRGVGLAHLVADG